MAPTSSQIQSLTHCVPLLSPLSSMCVGVDKLSTPARKRKASKHNRKRVRISYAAFLVFKYK